ncbi:MAG: hypothetical protein VKL98_08625, partial [Cyanobacteriota bacterium]|nr:hypothetical protein [Cyanobacteriota bacterium]
PLYLATHISQGRQLLLRILGSRQPQNIPSPPQRSAFYSYLQAVQDLRLAFLPAQITGFEEEGVCYQVLSVPAGSTLKQQISPQQPLSLAQTLGVLKSLIDLLEALRPLSWSGLCLQPDQIWWDPDRAKLTWIGFGFPSYPLPAHEHIEQMLVQGLGDLLYFLLTGHHAAYTRAPLEVDLCHRHPGLPSSVIRALQLAGDPQPISLTEWVQQLLPPQFIAMGTNVDHGTATNGTHPVDNKPPVPAQAATALTRSIPTQITARTMVTATAPSDRKGSPRPRLATVGLLGTAIGAGLSGLVIGLQLRAHMVEDSHTSRFNPNQSFPPLADWDGNRLGSQPVGPRNRRLRQPDYGQAPAPIQTPTQPPVRVSPQPSAVPSEPQPQPSAELPSQSPEDTLLEAPTSPTIDNPSLPALALPSEPAPPPTAPAPESAPATPPLAGQSDPVPPAPITTPPPGIPPAPSPAPVNL